MIAGRRVLVTGGGSGAGADLALGFAHAGAAEVVICGRRMQALDAVATSAKAVTSGAATGGSAPAMRASRTATAWRAIAR